MSSKDPSLLPAWLTERMSLALPKAAVGDDALQRIARQLQARAQQSLGHEQGLITVRAGDSPWSMLADGLHVRELYRSGPSQGLRPGEPSAVELWNLDAGFEVTMPVDRQSMVEWLLVRGDVEIDGRAFHATGSIRDGGGTRARQLRSHKGAVLYRRSGLAPVGSTPSLMADLAPSRWEPMMEGVERLPLWSDGVQEAYIIRARAGAQAPAHHHSMDEECLVLEGEMYFGDQLMRAGDFQLVPAGRDHTVIEAATDALLYQRGEVLAR